MPAPEPFLAIAEGIALWHGYSPLRFTHVEPGGRSSLPRQRGAYLQLTDASLEYPVGTSEIIYVGHTSCEEGLFRRPGQLTSQAMRQANDGEINILERFQWAARRGGAEFAYVVALPSTQCTTAALEAAWLQAFWMHYRGKPRFAGADTSSATCLCPQSSVSVSRFSEAARLAQDGEAA